MGSKPLMADRAGLISKGVQNLTKTYIFVVIWALRARHAFLFLKEPLKELLFVIANSEKIFEKASNYSVE